MPGREMRRAAEHHEIADAQGEVRRYRLRHDGGARTREGAQKGRLAGAVGADDRHARTLGDGERDVVERDNGTVVDGFISQVEHGG